MLNAPPSRSTSFKTFSPPALLPPDALVAPLVRDIVAAVRQAAGSGFVVALTWALVRLAVAAVCVGLVLGIAQFSIHLLIGTFADNGPYTGVG